MSVIRKDNSITPVSISKQRKKTTSLGVDPDRDIIFIHYDVIALDGSNNEIYPISKNNSIEIPKARFDEPLVAAFIQAAKNMVENEY